MKHQYININNTRLDISPLIQLLSKGKKIVAIKEVREKTNLGLKEAKELVEQIEAGSYQNQKKTATTNTSTLRGSSHQIKAKEFNVVEQYKGGGKAIPLGLGLAIIALLVYYFTL